MILFSKRNSANRRNLTRKRSMLLARDQQPDEDPRDLFLPDDLRNRLQEAITYLIRSADYIEKFLIVIDDEGSGSMHIASLAELSRRELGNDITEIMEKSGTTFLTSYGGYSDYYFLTYSNYLLFFASKRNDKNSSNAYKIFSMKKMGIG